MASNLFTAIERNSNSWHILRVREVFHYEADNAVIDYYEIANEYDVSLGELESVIETVGVDTLITTEDANIFLHTFPKGNEDGK